MDGRGEKENCSRVFPQIEILAKGSERTNEDKALIVKAKLQGSALQILSG